VGLACGGTIDVFVQRLDSLLLGDLVEHVERGEPVALTTVVASDADGGGNGIGESSLVTRDGTTEDSGSMGVRKYAQEMLAARSERGEIHRVEPGLEVYIEPFLPRAMLLIVGGVHVAIPLTRFAKELGFSVTIVDPRAKFANRERFPEADEVLLEWPDEAFAHLEVNDATYVVLLTHDPKIDEPTLAAALRTEAAYIGAIGSRGTHTARFERMQKWGVSPDELGRVYAPIGLDLGGRTPEETALSVIAEVIAVKNGRSGASLRETKKPIGQG
jgi:xanthine dehydrogenase accessory factor